MQNADEYPYPCTLPLTAIVRSATGLDAWLGYRAGADYHYGRESRDEFGEGWDRYGERWSPKEPDNKILGTSVIWNSEQTNTPSRFPEVPWAMPVAKDHEAINGDWYWEYSADHLHQVDDAEQIRDHLLRAIFGAFSNAKRHPKNATVKLKWVAFVGGKRESRRLMGDYVYTMKDASEHREFPDTVVCKRHGALPREVGEQRIAELRKLIGYEA